MPGRSFNRATRVFSVSSYLIQGSPKPIVLTGAQRPIGFDSTDSKTNLRGQLRSQASLRHLRGDGAAGSDEEDALFVFRVRHGGDLLKNWNAGRVAR